MEDLVRSNPFFGNGSPLSKYTTFFKSLQMDVDLMSYFGIGKAKTIRLLATQALTNRLDLHQCYALALKITIKAMKFFKRKQHSISKAIKLMNSGYPNACDSLNKKILATMQTNYNDLKINIKKEIESYKESIEPALKKQNQLDHDEIEFLRLQNQSLIDQLENQKQLSLKLSTFLNDRDVSKLEKEFNIVLNKGKSKVILKESNEQEKQSNRALSSEEQNKQSNQASSSRSVYDEKYYKQQINNLQNTLNQQSDTIKDLKYSKNKLQSSLDKIKFMSNQDRKKLLRNIKLIKQSAKDIIENDDEDFTSYYVDFVPNFINELFENYINLKN